MQKRILILDDEEETLDLLTRMLHKKYQVVTERHPSKLMASLENFLPDLVIIDHFIGDENSRDVIDEFRKNAGFKNIPIIIHSAHEQIEQLAESVHAAGYIRKPTGIAEIRSYIQEKIGE